MSIPITILVAVVGKVVGVVVGVYFERFMRRKREAGTYTVLGENKETE